MWDANLLEALVIFEALAVFHIPELFEILVWEVFTFRLLEALGMLHMFLCVGLLHKNLLPLDNIF